MHIFDFDDTLFNTTAFLQARLHALLQCGVSEEIFLDTYKQARTSPEGLATYSNERHAQMLVLRGFDEENILAALESTSTPHVLESFINEGAIECLEHIKQMGKPMILLSLGDQNFQEVKTMGSGVHTYFDRTFMVNDTKMHVLEHLLESIHPSEVWFINDKVKETKELTSVFKDMNVVLKKSPRIDEEEYKTSGYPYFDSLEDIAHYVTE